MQKILLVFVLLVMSEAQELTPNQASKLRNYNHSLSGKMRYQKLLQQIAVIKKDEADNILKEECQSEVYSFKLSARSNRLFYTFYTDKGTVQIDALDGEIMQGCNK